MEGQFIVAAHPTDSDKPSDILFQLSMSATAPVPTEQDLLKTEIEKTLGVLRGLFSPGDPKFRKYYEELLSLARYGLVGTTAQPTQAQITLKNFQAELFNQEKSRAVSRYIFGITRSLLLFICSLGIPMLILSCLAIYSETPLIAQTLFYLTSTLLGLFLGVTFTSFLRCKAVEFYDLHIIEADKFTPHTKSMFSIVVLAIAAIFLKAKIIDISIGEVKFQDFDSSFLAAISFGTVIGVAQEAVISSIESIRSKVGPKK